MSHGTLQRPQRPRRSTGARTRTAPPPRLSPTRLWAALLAIGWAGQVFLRLWFSWRETLPRLTPDETGYLLAARILTGGAGADFSGFTFYQVGYALLIAPAYWLSHDPHTVYRIVMVMNALVNACLLVLAYIALRRLSVRRSLAYVLAHATALLPAIVYWEQFAMTDTVLPLVVLGWLLLAHSWLTRGGLGYGIAASALAGYAYAAHARGTVILVVHIALVGYVALKRQKTKLELGIAAQGLTIVAAVAWGLNHYIMSRLYPSGPYSMSQAVTQRLTSVDGLERTFSLGMGQIWYLVVCTWGVAGLGIVVLGYVAFRSTSGTYRAMAVAVLTTLVGVALASSAALADEHAANNYLYGRYVACLAPVLFLVGAATVARAPRGILVRGFLATAALAGITGGIAAWYAGDRLSKYPFMKFNFPEISFLIRDWNTLHMWQSTGAALLLLALAISVATLLGRESDMVMGMALIGVNVLTMVVTTYLISWPMAHDVFAAGDLFPAGLRAGDHLAIDYSNLNFRVWQLQAYEAPDRIGFRKTDPRSLPSDATLVVVSRQSGTAAKLTWPAAPRGWYPVLERDDWVAWRPLS